jgi:hypothetical protein
MVTVRIITTRRSTAKACRTDDLTPLDAAKRPSHGAPSKGDGDDGVQQHRDARNVDNLGEPQQAYANFTW